MSTSKTILFLFLSLQFLAGCRATYGPKETTPTRKQLETTSIGGWITFNSSPNNSVSGELIAVSDDSLYVLVNPIVQVYAKPDNAEIILFNTATRKFAGWTTAGAFATLTNGFGLIFTLPIMLSVGIATAVTESHRPNIIEYPQTSWTEISKFARFPQGLPEGVDIRLIKLAYLQGN